MFGGEQIIGDIPGALIRLLELVEGGTPTGFDLLDLSPQFKIFQIRAESDLFHPAAAMTPSELGPANSRQSWRNGVPSASAGSR